MDGNVWASETIQVTAYAVIAYLGGLLVELKNVKVNYTRKINFFALYVVPLILGRLFPYEPTVLAIALRSVLGAGIFAVFLQPIRARVPVFQTMFSSFDRPEDRPHTLLWLSTQILAGYAVLIPMSAVFARYGISELMFIPVLIHGIGDGLAEPVGIRFGKHKYTTREFLSRARRHMRSYEGSACVFFSGILAVSLFCQSFTPAQYAVALLTVPMLMTLAEAWSPHTWDTPYMFLTGSASLWAIKVWL